MVLEQDGEDTGAILLEDGVIGKISYVFRRSLNCFAGTGSQRGRSRSGGSVWILCNNQVRERRRPRGLGGSGGDRGEVKWNSHFQQCGRRDPRKSSPATWQRDPELDGIPNTSLELPWRRKIPSILLPSPSHGQNLTGSGEQQQGSRDWSESKCQCQIYDLQTKSWARAKADGIDPETSPLDWDPQRGPE